MHTNHRRQHVKRNCKKGWPRPYSLKGYKQDHHATRRAEAREAMEKGRYDDLSNRDPQSLLWEYW